MFGQNILRFKIYEKPRSGVGGEAKNLSFGRLQFSGEHFQCFPDGKLLQDVWSYEKQKPHMCGLSRCLK